ncbi:MAG: hypothetical protein JXR07_09560 [Reichenbachiella sp.]
MFQDIIKVGAFSIALCILNYVVVFVGFGTFVHSLNYWVIGFLCITYAGIHFSSNFLEKTLEVDFTLIWLGAVTARLLIALFSFLIVALIIKDDLVLFAANFSAIYLSFLVFEIITVLSNLRPNSRLDRNND